MTVKYVIKTGVSIKTIWEKVRWSSYADVDIPKRPYISWDAKHRTV
jgi:hypothetical protein